MVTSICVAERHAFAGDASRKHDIEGAESEAKRGKARALHVVTVVLVLTSTFMRSLMA